jgi:NAD(P)-dependent dehydrogenase (short-subunit alcohol dehydrogenase family)
MAGEPASLERWQRVIDINLTGSFNLARLVAARIVKAYPRPSRRVDLQKLVESRQEIPDVVPGGVAEDRGVIVFTSSLAYEEGKSHLSI